MFAPRKHWQQKYSQEKEKRLKREWEERFLFFTSTFVGTSCSVSFSLLQSNIKNSCQNLQWNSCLVFCSCPFDLANGERLKIYWKRGNYIYGSTSQNLQQEHALLASVYQSSYFINKHLSITQYKLKRSRSLFGDLDFRQLKLYFQRRQGSISFWQ